MDRKRDGPGPITLSRVFIQKCKNGTHPTHRHIKKLQVEMWNRLLGTNSRVCYIYTLTITRITYHFFPPIFITRVITFFPFFFSLLFLVSTSHTFHEMMWEHHFFVRNVQIVVVMAWMTKRPGLAVDHADDGSCQEIVYTTQTL